MTTLVILVKGGTHVGCCPTALCVGVWCLECYQEDYYFRWLVVYWKQISLASKQTGSTVITHTLLISVYSLRMIDEGAGRNEMGLIHGIQRKTTLFLSSEMLWGICYCNPCWIFFLFQNISFCCNLHIWKFCPDYENLVVNHLVYFPWLFLMSFLTVFAAETTQNKALSQTSRI